MNSVVDVGFAAAKKALRLRVDTHLKHRANELVNAESLSICANVASKECYRNASTIAAFLSMAHEVQTNEIIKVSSVANKTILVPRVIGKHSADMEFLQLRDYNDISHLPKDKWGIPTPDACFAGTDIRRPCWPDLTEGTAPLSLVLVPGVAFDVRGGRLGHGKGYYDAFLKRVIAQWRARGDGTPKPLFVGLCFDAQIMEPGAIPMAEHDVYMDMLVTPSRVIDCNSSSDTESSASHVGQSTT